MKRYLLLILTAICISTSSVLSQTIVNSNPTITKNINNLNTDHEYIFNGNVLIYECNAVGVKVSEDAIIAHQGNRFYIRAINYTSGDFTIQFLNFTDTKSISLNGKYFLLSKADMEHSCSDNTDASKWVINYGALIIPFKFRPTKSLFTSNLNLGSSIYFQYKMSPDWAHGVVVGISLSSVTLDSLSTRYKIKTNTDRPAFTPSLSYVISYKNISFTAGVGTDIINKTSIIEKSWIFNGKPWIGFGIGINLFSSGGPTSNTTPTKDQTKPDNSKDSSISNNKSSNSSN